MRVPLLPVLILILVGLALDCYIYRRFRAWRVPRAWLWVYIAIAAIASLGILAVDLAPKKAASDSGIVLLMWVLFTYLSIYIPNFLFAAVSLLGQGLGLLFRRPLRGFPIAGGVLALGLCAAFWWGALVTRFQIQINEVEVPVAGLPRSFDGYRIVQFSDLHTGSFALSSPFVSRFVAAINSCQPDLIAFTGDVVNRHSSELEPFAPALAALSAPDGVVSVLGNHDYGDYSSWPSDEAHLADIKNICRLERSLGWRLLNNEHISLHRGLDSLVIIGVENIGDPPFRVSGDLYAAYPNIADSASKVLLSHNPAHWLADIAGNPHANIALTLAGHTHAMQFEVLGLSPAAWRYKTWGGLYPDSLGRHLYVNTGAGEVGYPARVGVKPEITVITLRRAQ